MTSPADWADAQKRTAYVYLRLPHSSPAVAGGALPFPSDVLTAPIQIQVDWADFNTVISKSTSGPVCNPPTSFSSAQANFTQVTMQDSQDLVARRFDMSKNALTIPLPECWTQEQVSFPVTTGPDGSFSVSLTGCKAGDLKALRIFIADPADVSSTGITNPNIWYAPNQLTFAINGLIYFDSRNGSYLLTQVLRRRQPPNYGATLLTDNGAGGFNVATTASTFVEINLGQPHVIGDTGRTALVHGVPVMNSVLSLTGVMPLASHSYQIFAEYDLNCSWMASRGSAEFVF